MTALICVVAALFRYVCKSDSPSVLRLQVLVVAVLSFANEVLYLVTAIWSCTYTPLLPCFYRHGARGWAVAVAAASPQLSNPMFFIGTQQICCPCGTVFKYFSEALSLLGVGESIGKRMAKDDGRLEMLGARGHFEAEDGMIHDVAEGWGQPGTSSSQNSGKNREPLFTDLAKGDSVPAPVPRRWPRQRIEVFPARRQTTARGSNAAAGSAESGDSDESGANDVASRDIQHLWRVDWARFVTDGFRGIQSLAGAERERRGSALSMRTEEGAGAAMHPDSDDR